MDSKSLARIIGPSLIVLTLSEAVNLHIWSVNDPRITYLNGFILFVAGLSIVCAHPRWARSWPVIVTIVGWAAMLGGLFRMFFPQLQSNGNNLPTFGVMATLFIFGVLLTLNGYRGRIN